MAHAYETFATGGKLIYGTLSPGQSKKSLPVPGPVGIERIDRVRGKKTKLVELADGERMINKRQEAHGPQAGDRRPGRRAAAGRRQEGHGDARADPGRDGRRQDRHDRELRRRLVRGLDEGVHGRRVGRLSGRVQADEDRVPGRAGRRRHVPGGDLEDLHGVAAEVRPAAQEGRRRRDGQGPRADPDAEPATATWRRRRRRRPRRPPRRPRRRPTGRRHRRHRAARGHDTAAGHHTAARTPHRREDTTPPATDPGATDPGTGGARSDRTACRGRHGAARRHDGTG